MKKKLNLGDLKVKSFVTDLENRSVNTVKGGGHGYGGGAVGTLGEYVTQVNDCDKDSSPHKCPTQDRVGACNIESQDFCGSGHGGCATIPGQANGC